MAKQNVRKTANDYKKEWVDLQIKQERIANQIRQRLLEISTANPEAIVSTMGDTDIKAKSIASANYIKTIEVPACILCIQRIEDWLTNQHPHKQTTIQGF